MNLIGRVIDNMTDNKKTIEVSQSAVLFAGVVMMAMMGFGGYLYGKVKGLEKAGTAAAAPAAQQQQQPQVTVTRDQLEGLFDGKTLAFGKKDSKLIFVEFSDPSCPYCHVAAGKNASLNKQMGQQFMLKADGGTYVAPVPEMKKLVDEGKASMVWVYANGHGNGELGTEALYCANEKGKFWEVHDTLMSAEGYEILNTSVKNDRTQAAKMADFLKKAVDSKFMESCLKDAKYKDRLTTDMETATKFGFSGTPSFFVNTQNFAGAYSYTEMEKLVNDSI